MLKTLIIALGLAVLTIPALGETPKPPCDCQTFCVTPLTAGACGRCAPTTERECRGKPRPVAKPPGVKKVLR